ncbi:MAG: DUF1570 domain-containing protein [Isosphaeraceae bacterium]
MHPTVHARPPAIRKVTCAAAWGAPLLLLLLSVGCATLGSDPGQPLVPTRAEARTGPFVIYSSTKLGPESAPIRSLRSLEADVASTLGVRAAATETPVEIYILRDRDTFTHFLTFYFPELPPRRAFFIAQGGRRVVYTFQNDRLTEDLRHEATHALLHLAVGDLPLWLDEGLAEYFEGTSAPLGVNPEHLERLPDDLASGWKPDLAHLESLKNVREMTPRDYRESWAWVHYLLNDSAASRALLLSWLSEHRRGDGQEGLASRLEQVDRSAPHLMLAHLEKLRKAPPSRPSLASESAVRTSPSTVLLQSAPLEPTPRRSAMSRFLGFLGLGGRGQ